MTSYIIRRALLFIPTAVGVSIVIFFLLHVIPGDYATSVVLGGEDRANLATEEEIQRVREQLGLDRNIVIQYRDWAADFFTGDLGQSLTNRQSVAERMLPRIAVSAQLAVMAVAIAVIVAIPFGVIAAVRQDTLIDYGLRFFSMIFESMPNFWLGLLVLVGLAVIFDWKPPHIVQGPMGRPLDQSPGHVFPGPGGRRPRLGGDAADDPLLGPGSIAGGLCPHRPRQGTATGEDSVHTRPAQRSAARYHPCGFRGSLSCSAGR